MFFRFQIANKITLHVFLMNVCFSIHIFSLTDKSFASMVTFPRVSSIPSKFVFEINLLGAVNCRPFISPAKSFRPRSNTASLGLCAEEMPTDVIASSILGTTKVYIADKIASCNLVLPVATPFFYFTSYLARKIMLLLCSPINLRATFGCPVLCMKRNNFLMSVIDYASALNGRACIPKSEVTSSLV